MDIRYTQPMWTRVQLQKSLTFIVEDRGYKQRILDTRNQCSINILFGFKSNAALTSCYFLREELKTVAILFYYF